MKKSLISGFFAICALAFIASTAAADEKTTHNDRWYKTDSGRYVIEEFTKGVLYATLGKSKSGQWRVYIEKYDDQCQSGDESIIDHNPLKINGTLVKISQYCNNKWRVFFAPTDAGGEYLVNQFKRGNQVVVETTDGTKFIFKTQDFTESLSLAISNENAL